MNVVYEPSAAYQIIITLIPMFGCNMIDVYLCTVNLKDDHPHEVID